MKRQTAYIVLFCLAMCVVILWYGLASGRSYKTITPRGTNIKQGPPGKGRSLDLTNETPQSPLVEEAMLKRRSFQCPIGTYYWQEGEGYVRCGPDDTAMAAVNTGEWIWTCSDDEWERLKNGHKSEPCYWEVKEVPVLGDLSFYGTESLPNNINTTLKAQPGWDLVHIEIVYLKTTYRSGDIWLKRKVCP